MFWHVGLRVFDTPMRELCVERTSAGLAFERATGLPDNYVCEWPGDRPMVMNWQAYPRPYPPGALLYAAPEAVLYAHTSLSLYVVDRIAIVKDLLVGHLLVLVLLELLAGWQLLLSPLVYAGVVPWAAAGFYDPIAVLLVCWAIVRLERERPLDALACLAGAAFLHFRAIWYVPLGVVALARLRASPGELRSRRGILLVAIGLVAVAGALLALRLAGPSLGTFPRTNPALLTRPSLATLGFVVLAIAACATLAHHRQWLLVALVAWQALVIGLTRQAQFWHPMFLLPLLALGRRARWPVVIAIVAWIVGVAILDGTPAMVVRFVHDVATLNV
ncbi:MAG TPA: hypothetical protein VLT45_18525 [Kofleriaceae bacterium]|nr:hypothetical protein [Kofleriaceae bacterium]